MTSGARYSSVPTKELARPSGCATSSACRPEARVCGAGRRPPSVLARLPDQGRAPPSVLARLLRCGLAGVVLPPCWAVALPVAARSGRTSREGVVLPWQ